jgi:hypothetical protein
VNYPVVGGPVAVAAGDFDGDGKLDLAAATSESGTVLVRLGDGAGGFGLAAVYDVGVLPISVAVGDFNGDSKLDVVTVNEGSYDVTVLLGNGDGTFQSASVVNQFTDQPLSAAVGDFNADGKMDLAVGLAQLFPYSGPYGGSYTGYAGEVGVLLGTGHGGFDLPAAWTLTGTSQFDSALPYDLTVGDLNGDGKQDLAAAVAYWSYYISNYFVIVHFGDGSGGLSSDYSYSAGAYPAAVATGDFTGDGKLDLVSAGTSVDVFPGTGSVSLGPVVSTAGGPNRMTDVAVADVNGDGKLDLVAVDPTAGTVNVFLGVGGGNFNAPLASAVGTNPAAVLVGKFNADASPDVAVANTNSDTVSILLNDGTWPAVVPWIKVSDASVKEGNSGTVAANFTVTLTAASPDPVTVQFTTSPVTATAGTDYQSVTTTVTFAPGETSQTVSVPVIGDRLPEFNETFLVTLSNATNGSIYDGQGTGTILDDEPRIKIDNVSNYEGNGKSTTAFVFTVTLSAAYDQAVTVNFATSNGTATAGSDYQSKSGILTFAPGVTSQTITILVYGDSKWELNETFYVNLSGASGNAVIDVTRGVGTIWNDDRR